MSTAHRALAGFPVALDTPAGVIAKTKAILWQNAGFADELKSGEIIMLDAGGKLALSSDFGGDLLDQHIGRVNGTGKTPIPLFKERRFFGSLWLVAGVDEAKPDSMLVIVRRAELARSLVEILQPMFNLGRREAEVAWHIANGREVKDISAKMGISVATARVYLRQIFAKTDTNKQTALVALIHRIAVPI